MGGAKAFVSAAIQRLMPQQQTPILRVNSQQYDEGDVHRSVRRLSKTMRAAAAQRDAITAMRWTYVVETTLEEMERAAAAEHRLMELRIALLQVQPACKHFLADIRHVVLESHGDQALPLLRYAVAWRKVFGNSRPNALQAILDLAAMGAALRSHVEPAGGETIYVATAQDLDALEWNKRGTNLEPSEVFLGSGYSPTRKTHRLPHRTGGLPLAISPELPALEPGNSTEIDLRGVPLVTPAVRGDLEPMTPAEVARAPERVDRGVASIDAGVAAVDVAAIAVSRPEPVATENQTPAPRGIEMTAAPAPPPHTTAPPGVNNAISHFPHISSPHPVAAGPPTRLAQIVHPDVAVPTSATRPLLRRMAARMDGLGEPSAAHLPRPVEFPGTIPPPSNRLTEPLFPPNLPSAAQQVEKAIRGAMTDMHRFNLPKRPAVPERPPMAPDPPAQLDSAPRAHRGRAAPRAPDGRRPPGPRAPHRSI